jgi:hypothetical protein
MIIRYAIDMKYIWVNYSDLTVLTNPGIRVFIGESSPNGRKIQVSEIL